MSGTTPGSGRREEKGGTFCKNIAFRKENATSFVHCTFLLIFAHLIKI